jgi:ferredoxin-NADP reductase/MOSC domain-containing protein YiiM/ferredoxin
MSGRAATLMSVNVGLPRDVPWQGKTVRTGIWKAPVSGPAMVRRLNIDGDGQGDTAGHGGEQRAVFVYQAQSYRYWQRYLGRDDLSPDERDYGQFGENFTVDGLADDQVCIGDRYRIGEAEFEVTQPRVTCYRVGLRLGEPRMPALLVSQHRPGFYLRVIREGRVQAGDPIVRTGVGPHALTVAGADALLYLPGRDTTRLRDALDIPALSPGWQGSFRELLAAAEDGGEAGGQAAGVSGAATAVSAAPAWPGFRPLQVTRLDRESDDVTSVYLAAGDGTPLPPARAGQYLTLRLAGAGQPAPVRSYSLSSAPGTAAYRISVKREPHGAASTYLNTRLRPDALVEVAAPRGDFVLADGDGPVLLVSAGIGVTPVLAMLHQLAEGRTEREVWWLYGARNPREHPFAAEAHALLATLPHAREHVYYSAATPAECRAAHASPGRLTPAVLAGLPLPAGAAGAYVCGPAAFMAAMRTALTGAGLAAAAIRTELFGALPPVRPGIIGKPAPPPHLPSGPREAGPLVTFARSGITAPFGDSRPSVLDLADACDVPARWSCRTGVCHTCVTPLLSGGITYAPDPLEPPPAGQVLICCARPAGDIVLDM